MERGSAGQLLAVNTFVWVTTALYAPFIGAYYAEQGITPFQVGVLTCYWTSGFHIDPTFVGLHK